MPSEVSRPPFWLWPTVGVLIIVVGAGLDMISGALGGAVCALGGILVTTNIVRIWRAPARSRIALMLTLAGICVVVGVVGAVLLSAWEWVLVVYGVVLAVFGLVPVRRDLRVAAADARR